VCVLFLAHAELNPRPQRSSYAERSTQREVSAQTLLFLSPPLFTLFSRSFLSCRTDFSKFSPCPSQLVQGPLSGTNCYGTGSLLLGVGLWQKTGPLKRQACNHAQSLSTQTSVVLGLSSARTKNNMCVCPPTPCVPCTRFTTAVTTWWWWCWLSRLSLSAAHCFSPCPLLDSVPTPSQGS